ncbi:hypothetical protein [Runella sp.]|uniref:restriction endonuclease subunit S n=1 Tax=Runella sp. TaxID=1960881 RepID=UPI003016D086
MKNMEQINTFQKYPAYKDSGVEWIGEIPEGWNTQKGKWLFNKQERPVRRQDEIVTCFRDGQVTLRANRKTEGFTNALKEHGYQGIRRGDLVIHNMDAFAGAIGVSESDGKSTPVYSVCTPRQLNKVNPHYYAYFLRDLAKNGFIESLAKGIRERSTDFRFSDFSVLFLTLPPLPEQTRIAHFLDRKTAQIDQAIAQKERLIELLKERRQILIHNAVTRGLDPNVKMKDSGVEWIGEVPEHWEVRRLKVFSTVQSGVTLGKTYTGNNIASFPYLRVANVQAGYLDLSVIAEIQISLSDVPKYLVRKGDILVTEGGDIDKLGRGTIWQGEIENCLHQNHIFAIRVDLSIALSEFIEICLGADYGRKYFTNTANKTTNLASTNSTKLGNFPVAMPTLSEQYDIVNYVAHLNQKIGAAIACKQSEIEKLKEYKATLINSAVTGKIKVV